MNTIMRQKVYQNDVKHNFLTHLMWSNEYGANEDIETARRFDPSVFGFYLEDSDEWSEWDDG